MARNKPASAALPNAFVGKSKPPTGKELAAALGAAKSLWERLLLELADELKLTEQEWNTSSPKLGWSLRVKSGDRIIVYLAPLEGCFRASFALGEKAVKAALAMGIPAPVVEIIKSAKKYAEGTAVRVEVREPGDVEVVKKLVRAKLG